MAQKNLTYSVRGIFTDCLTAHNAERYLIAAYQRGYKWDSEDQTEKGGRKNQTSHEVDKLLSDLWRQFESQTQSGLPVEYYLQFLTLKSSISYGANQVLEVIDGQQRLTTLSVFFAVLRHLTQDPAEQNWFAFTEANAQGGYTGKLEYGVREHFLDYFVYQGNVQYLLQAISWKEFIITSFPQIPSGFDLDQQDIFYLFKAARRIQHFLEADNRRSQMVAFGRYVADYGRLIANVIEAEISSEEVFSNLNSNRKPLTDTELLKGLLLTRAYRQGVPRTFQEIQELRSAQGRQWDEITRWLNQSSVLLLYGLEKSTALWQILRIVALRLTVDTSADLYKVIRGLKPVENQYPLFDLFEKLIRLGKPGTSAAACFAELRLVVALLQDWHDKPELHNLLGVLRVSEGYSPDKKEKLLAKLLSEKNLQKGTFTFLRGQISELECLKKKPNEMSYDEPASQAFDFLLLLNVFPKRPNSKSANVNFPPFDFVHFKQQQWSLEHIYPQNPALVADADGQERHQLRAFYAQGDSLTPAQQALLTVPNPNEQQLEELRGWRQKSTALLHSIGNLALLASKDNSSFGNLPFGLKQQAMITRIQKGSFVPSHTFSVFSKLILSDPGHADQWSNTDIQNHFKYLVGEHNRLLGAFPMVINHAPSI